MRILILGGDGMLGHSFFVHLGSVKARPDVRVTLRQEMKAYQAYGIFTPANAFACIDARSIERLVEVLAEFQPEVVINCVGIVKQRSAAKESIPCLELNALLPHRLAILCKMIGARLVHLSTDCVFSGNKGNYTEDDVMDAVDLYGRTKALGEVHEKHCLTIRTSSVGYELGSQKGLLEWFLSQRGPVNGFVNAIYTGLATPELSRVVESLIFDYPSACGLYQISGNPINKYELLTLFKRILNHPIEVIPEGRFRCDRSLDSRRFRKEFSYAPPSWEAMIESLKANNRNNYVLESNDHRGHTP
jgi:dTDP-4-dehydrorhamnose reductase